MLKNSFIQLRGIGEKKEKSIWKAGILDWDNYILYNKIFCNNYRKIGQFSDIEKCIDNLKKRNAKYFYNILPSSESWRLYKEFQNNSLYVDIETNGGDFYSGYITTIATYDGKDIRYYINGRNLDDFIDDISDYKILITYNGKLFDIPYIENYFNIKLDHGQIDLRYTLNSLGYKGGLKSCEKQLGLNRNGLDHVDGFFAIHLWNDFYYNANQKALETLLAYNIEDCINLEKLMQTAFNMKVDKLGFKSFKKVSYLKSAKNPFKADYETIFRIKTKIKSIY